jgi:hypothetical protein
MTNDIKAIENKFVTAMGSGIAASGYLLEIVASVIKSEDGRPLASAIARLNSKGDKQGSNAVRAIIGAIFVGAKVKTANDKKTIVLSLKDAKFDDAAMQRLSDGVERKLSLRSTLVKEVKGDVEKAPVDLPKKMAAVLKLMEKEGFSKAACIAALQAA